MGNTRIALAIVVFWIALDSIVVCINAYSSSGGTGYTNPEAVEFLPKQVIVAGKRIALERVLCLRRQTKCFLHILQCPAECPKRKPANLTAKACFTDCGPKCETSCKNRVPSCNGYGSVCYDPRLVGGDGVMVYFHGNRDENFCLVSDSNIQINAHLIGTRPPGRNQDYTWLQSLGIMFTETTPAGRDDTMMSFTVGTASKVPVWNDSIDRLEFSFDGRPFTIPQSNADDDEDDLSAWNSPDGSIRVERTAESNGAIVYVKNIAEISLKAVGVSEKDNRTHNYQLPANDCFAHLDIQFKFFNLSANVEGILGQTYRPQFRNPVKSGIPMPVMGGEDRYRTSSLVASDCRSCVFSPQISGDATVGHGDSVRITSAQCSSSFGSEGGTACRR